MIPVVKSEKEVKCICSFHVGNAGLGDRMYSWYIRFDTKEIQGSYGQTKMIEFEDMISIVALVEIYDGFGLPKSPCHSSLIKKF